MKNVNKVQVHMYLKVIVEAAHVSEQLGKEHVDCVCLCTENLLLTHTKKQMRNI